MRDPGEIARRLDELQQKIGIAFKDPALLQEALSHSSFANENPSISPHDNERLEYLGDAVLQLISAEYLFKGRPAAEEGEMTQVRSSMVNTQALAALSEDLGMGEYLLLGKGIARGGGRNLRSLLANAFEAVLGAIFLDQGYDAAYHYCIERFRALPEVEVQENHKGRLQHLVQDRYGVTPVYDSIGSRAQSGRTREYTAVVYAGGDPLGTGHGRTKQTAEQTAAKEAIKKLLDEAATPQPSRPAPAPPAPVTAVEPEPEVQPAAAGPEIEPPAPAEVAAASSEAVQDESPEAAPQPEEVVEPARPAAGWRSRREVAEHPSPPPRPTAPPPAPEPEPESIAAAPEPVPAPPEPVPIASPSRQFGAPAAEVEIEVISEPPPVDHLVAAPATSRMPAAATATAEPPRQFGQPVPEPEPVVEAKPAPRRRTSRARKPPADTAGTSAATPGPEGAEAPKPARRRSTRARTAAPAEGDAASTGAAAPRRRTSRARTAAQEPASE